MAKRAGVLKRGLRPNETPDVIAAVWIAWGFQANCMSVQASQCISSGASQCLSSGALNRGLRTIISYIPIHYYIHLEQLIDVDDSSWPAMIALCQASRQWLRLIAP